MEVCYALPITKCNNAYLNPYNAAIYYIPCSYPYVACLDIRSRKFLYNVRSQDLPSVINIRGKSERFKEEPTQASCLVTVPRGLGPGTDLRVLR